MRGWSFLPREGVFAEGPGSWGLPCLDLPSAVAWRGQPGPSLLGSSCTVSPAAMVPTWSVHAGRGRVVPHAFWNSQKPGGGGGRQGVTKQGDRGTGIGGQDSGGSSGTGRWTAWGPGVHGLCWGQGPQSPPLPHRPVLVVVSSPCPQGNCPQSPPNRRTDTVKRSLLKSPRLSGMFMQQQVAKV